MRIAVLRGGPSTHYHESLREGAFVRGILNERHNTNDIFIDTEGGWHSGGLATLPDKALRHPDLVWNAMHGSFGADGQVQQLLEQHAVNYTGPKPFAAASAFNPLLCRQILSGASLRLPTALAFTYRDTPTEAARLCFRELGGQYLIRTVGRGERLARTNGELLSLLEALLDREERVLVEERLYGKKAYCLVIDGFRGQALYPTLPFSQKPLSRGDENACMEIAARAHQALSLRGYSSAEVVLTSRGPVLLSISATPLLAGNKTITESLALTGATIPELIHHLALL